MTTQDKVIAAVRSAAAYLGTLLIGWLLSLGIDFPDSVDTQILLLAPAVGVFLYNLVANWLADRWPALGFLLLIPKQPVYDSTKPVLVPDSPPNTLTPPPTEGGDGGMTAIEALVAVVILCVIVLLVVVIAGKI